jgi:hypothetical protein
VAGGGPFSRPRRPYPSRLPGGGSAPRTSGCRGAPDRGLSAHVRRSRRCGTVAGGALNPPGTGGAAAGRAAGAPPGDTSRVAAGRGAADCDAASCDAVACGAVACDAAGRRAGGRTGSGALPEARSTGMRSVDGRPVEERSAAERSGTVRSVGVRPAGEPVEACGAVEACGGGAGWWSAGGRGAARPTTLAWVIRGAQRSQTSARVQTRPTAGLCRRTSSTVPPHRTLVPGCAEHCWTRHWQDASPRTVAALAWAAAWAWANRRSAATSRERGGIRQAALQATEAERSL